MELETPNNDNNGETSNSTTPDLRTPNNGETFNSEEPHSFSEDIDSTCSTPYVSAPSSPGRGHTTGFFYSAPASPMHFVLSSTPSISAYTASSSDGSGSFEFEFSGRLASNGLAVAGSMSSADELFLNGQIRPMKLSTHLQRPQVLAPLLDLDVEDEYDVDKDSDQLGLVRGRDLRMRDRSLRRRTRSLSPLRNAAFQINRGGGGGGGGGVIECEDQDDESNNNNNNDNDKQTETTPSVSASSSRSSSAGRSSKRWVFLKEFLYRSKSEGRSSNHHKFWSSISFSPAKDKKIITTTSSATSSKTTISEATTSSKTLSSSIEKKAVGGRASNGVGKRRVPPSPHELHYTANRAQAEEMKKKTFLPYRQGLLGCLGFSSKSYGAMNGFARALNPVSSR